MTNMDKLYEAVEARGPVCVGLDTDFSYLPADFVDSTLTKGENIVRFNKKLIDATKAVAGCYKVQIAYYESLGMEGMKAYADTLKAVREAGVPVIADIKRGDIAKTAEMYAMGHFTGDFEADFVTLAPYMGLDSISPYLPYAEKQGKGMFVLCRTSNGGAKDFEYEKLADGKVNEVELASALLDLSAMLHKHYAVAPIIIIDEYDTPIQQGYQKDYYDKVIRFMRNLFSGGFKDNQHLSFGFLTGILRVAKESIFSGMNNLSINSVLDNKYSAYFGFTADEVMEMAEYYGAANKYDEICRWYDGYRFGKTEIFNPWSVVNYFSNECEPRPFWVSTGSNDIIGEVLAQADEEIYNRLTSLVNGETFTTFIDTGVIYPQIKSNPSTIYSFLLVTGYLKALKTTPSFSGDFMCEVSLPNREISLVYNKEILQRLENLIPPSTAISVQETIFSGDNARLKAQIQTLLTQSVSSFDTAGENFYHGFMLGLCALLGGAFVTSNRESGDGRYDIQLKPTKKGLPGILIELKAEKNCSDEKLKKLSETALQQINDKKYETELTTAGVRTIYKYGVAFSGKKVEVAVG